MVTFLSKRSCKLDNAQDGAMLGGLPIILNPNRPHCCPLPRGLGRHWGTHPPACELEHIFSVFPNPTACSLRALTGTYPVLRGMAHRPSVMRSTLHCLVSRTLRHAMVSLYPDFTQTKPGWVWCYTKIQPLYFVISDQNRVLQVVQMAG